MTGLSLRFLSGLILLEVVLGASLDEIHHHMTPEEREEVFHTAGTFVPPYKVVQIHSSKVKRDVNYGHVVEMNLKGNRIRTWLYPLDGILISGDTKLYAKDKKSDLVEIPTYFQRYSKLYYESKPQKMTVKVDEDSRGKRSLTGIIGSHNLYVKPIPERAMNALSKKLNRSIDDEFESDHEDKSYHIVYEMPLAHDNSKIMAPLVKSVTRQKRSDSYNKVIYPEILVIVDWSLISKLNNDSRKAGANIVKVMPYLMGFWNGVDLKYRDLEEPRYRFHITGIILEIEPDVLPYMNKLNSEDVDVDATLEESGTWLYERDEDIPVKSYDMAVTMTAKNLMSKMESNKAPKRRLGLSYIGAACDIDEEEKTMKKTAVIHDEGGFGGIHTAAHEIGHLLGAEHDGSDHRLCPHNEGFIMAGTAVKKSRKSHDWSPCSRTDLANFLNTHPKCLLNKPTGLRIPRILPGMRRDANQQCEMLEKTKAVVIDGSICVELKCFVHNKPGFWKPMQQPAADGTPCGEERYCIHGKCISGEQLEEI